MKGKHWYSLSLWTGVLKISWWHLKNCDLPPFLWEPLFLYITWPECDLTVGSCRLWLLEFRWLPGGQRSSFCLVKFRHLWPASCPLTWTLLLTLLGTDPPSSGSGAGERGDWKQTWGSDFPTDGKVSKCQWLYFVEHSSLQPLPQEGVWQNGFWD